MRQKLLEAENLDLAKAIRLCQITESTKSELQILAGQRADTKKWLASVPSLELVLPIGNCHKGVLGLISWQAEMCKMAVRQDPRLEYPRDVEGHTDQDSAQLLANYVRNVEDATILQEFVGPWLRKPTWWKKV